MQPTGFILYEGPSMLDGAPIVAIATGFGRPSSNRKTGDMVQTYILRRDIAPLDALRTGADASVCGDCKHRQGQGGACYVNVGHGPRAVWDAYRRGRYPRTCNGKARPTAADHAEERATLGEGRTVRLGTYGDPAAVPAWVWEALTARASGRTGYTHQWANRSLPMAHREALRSLLMASVDTPQEAEEARILGWRYFRVRGEGEALGRREAVCPASEEAGKRRTCATCLACDGATPGRTERASMAIVVHGSLARRFAQRSPISN